MTYDELFQLKGLEKAKLLAGKSILGREISGAHVVEIVEAQDWVCLLYTSDAAEKLEV